ncbi:RES family NAD+ phosphorylase [bacterium]|nr:RES family NAD+ phosphorylase [bacterium]
MNLYRHFRWEPTKKPNERGGALWIPTLLQGAGRHDISETGVLYGTEDPISSIAEVLQNFRNLKDKISQRYFEHPDGTVHAIVKIHLEGNVKIIDCCRAKNLIDLNIEPAYIATHDRELTQSVSRKLYEKGYDGFKWWSALESKWVNVTLFGSRVSGKVKIIDGPTVLNIDMPEVISAAEWMGIKLIK